MPLRKPPDRLTPSLNSPRWTCSADSDSGGPPAVASRPLLSSFRLERRVLSTPSLKAFSSEVASRPKSNSKRVCALSRMR